VLTYSTYIGYVSKRSYALHQEWYNLNFPTVDSKVAFYQNAKATGKQKHGLQAATNFYKCLDLLPKQPGK
jgi:hypothetical protein